MVSCKQVNSQQGGALWSEGMTAPPYETAGGLPILGRARATSRDAP